MGDDDPGLPGPGHLGVFHLDREGTDDGTARMTALLDLQDATASIEALRAECLQRLGVTAGMTVVDLGSGTGTVARRLAELVGPDGRVLGVEPNARMRAVAASRDTPGSPAPTWVDAAADDLPFEDGSVDALWCERVFQHLDDPQAAASEIGRVLRPGGRAAVLDSDHGTQVSTVGSPAFHRALLETLVEQTPNAFAARHLPAHLRTAGLVVDPDVTGRPYLPAPAVLRAGAIMRPMADLAVAAGRVTAEERDATFAELERAVDAGEAFVAVTVFGFLATKPMDAGA